MFEKIMKKQLEEAKGREAIFDRLHLVRIKAVREKNIRYEACDNYSSTDKMVKILSSIFDDSDRELLVVISVDAKMRPIQAEVAAVGGIAECYVSVPNIFKGALLCNSSGIILAHKVWNAAAGRSQEYQLGNTVFKNIIRHVFIKKLHVHQYGALFSGGLGK